MRDNVRYLYTDLTGQTIQPVVFDEVADLEHNYTLTEPQRETVLRLMTQAKINARTFIDKDPNVKTTDEEESRSEVLNKYASFITNIYVDDNERTNDMEDLESFLGFFLRYLD